MSFKWPVLMRYNYQLATPRALRIKQGALEAYSYQQAQTVLSASGLKIVSLKLDWFASLKRLIKGKELSETSILSFFADLNRFLKAGLTINEACSTIEETTSDRNLKRAVETIKDDLAKGLALSDAVTRTKVFPDLTVTILKAGEQAGALEDISLFLRNYYSDREKFNSELKRAVFYPKIVFVFTLLALLFLSLYVLPKFQEALTGMGATNLPRITTIVMGIGMFINHYWILIAVGLAAIFLFLKAYLVHNKAEWVLRYVYQLPVIGEFAKEVTFTVIFMNLAVLVKGGINVSNSLELLSRNIPYRNVARRLSFSKQRLDRGESLSQALRQDKFFPALISLMVKKGETSGDLAVTFEEIAQIMQSRLSQKLDQIQKLIEPLLLLFLGSIVLLVYLAFFMVVYPALNSIAAMK